jgi:hypothetical protein
VHPTYTTQITSNSRTRQGMWGADLFSRSESRNTVYNLNIFGKCSRCLDVDVHPYYEQSSSTCYMYYVYTYCCRRNVYHVSYMTSCSSSINTAHGNTQTPQLSSLTTVTTNSAHPGPIESFLVPIG